MSEDRLEALRREIDGLNDELLRLLSRRGELALQVGRFKAESGRPTYDPTRESGMLARLAEANPGPFPDATIQRIFQEIFRASQDLMDLRDRRSLLVSRGHQREDTVVEVKGAALGRDRGALIAGPCSVESVEQLERIALHLKGLGVRWLRGGAYKPRTSPYSFQGLGEPALEMLAEVARRHDLGIVTEVLDPRHVERVAEVADVLQVGARNMYNYELLKEVGQGRLPVLLKRGFMATLEELLLSAEYVVGAGNPRVILCERGVRTFERWTRNTLDISAVPLLKQQSHLPVVVDISHAAGRRDILTPLGRAALAAGADALMVEVHDRPSVALSDGEQQLDLEAFTALVEALEASGLRGSAWAPR